MRLLQLAIQNTYWRRQNIVLVVQKGPARKLMCSKNTLEAICPEIFSCWQEPIVVDCFLKQWNNHEATPLRFNQKNNFYTTLYNLWNSFFFKFLMTSSLSHVTLKKSFLIDVDFQLQCKLLSNLIRSHVVFTDFLAD